MSKAVIFDPNYKLPCDVRLPPATTISAGCSIVTLLMALELAGRPKKFANDGFGVEVRAGEVDE